MSMHPRTLRVLTTLAVGTFVLLSSAFVRTAEAAPAPPTKPQTIRGLAPGQSVNSLGEYVKARDAARAARAEGRAVAVTCMNVLIQSLANGRYVAAEETHPVNFQRFRLTTNLPFADAFRTCDAGTYDYIYWSVGGNYVTTEAGYEQPYTGMLRARQDTVYGAREKFSVVCTSDYCYMMSHANTRYVAVEVVSPSPDPGDTGILRARTAGKDFGPWEKFHIG
ncbi:MAG TPA: hypothetical protein VFR67_16770 [Pilimelia sp.]|nr:hypothetical protein [Pilimelia sp.]